MTEPSPKDWIDSLVRFAGLLGFNQVQLRWKLMAWRDSWAAKKVRGRVQVEQINYVHKICPACGTIQDRDAKICLSCGRRLFSHRWQVLRRMGLAVPQIQSVSLLLTAGIVLCYLRMIFYEGGGGISGASLETLVDLGALYPPAIEAGQWWRFSTYIFLHMGLMHIAFNLMALLQIGPSIEEIFGKGRMLFYFMVTGILAGIGSLVLARHGLVVGASGSLMGLMGLAAGWGQRDGTATGRAVRDQMVKWLVYTILFGFFVHADNTAHLAGFAAGGVFGFFSKPRWEVKGSTFPWHFFQTAVGIVLALGTIGLVLFPP